MELLDVDFPATFERYDGVSAAAYLDRLRFPDQARHLALEVFARSFFADARDFSAGELVAMFHTYFLGSAEGLLFDVPVDDYDTALWAPLGRHLDGLGAEVRTGETVEYGRLGRRRRARRAHRRRRAPGVDAVVLAARPRRRCSGSSPPRRGLGDDAWRAPVAAQRSAPPFVVWRLWLDRRVAPGSAPFRATSGFGPLDNVSVLELLEEGAARWTGEHDGSVVELHAYAVDPPAADVQALRERLLARAAGAAPRAGRRPVLPRGVALARRLPAGRAPSRGPRAPASSRPTRGWCWPVTASAASSRSP